MADTEASGPSLSDTFNKLNHIRHWIMDISMISMAIGMAATMAGFPAFNILGNFIGMHFQGMLDLPQNISAFMSGTPVMDMAAHGSMHAMEAAEHGFTAAQMANLGDQAARFDMDTADYASEFTPHNQ